MQKSTVLYVSGHPSTADADITGIVVKNIFSGAPSISRFPDIISFLLSRTGMSTSLQNEGSLWQLYRCQMDLRGE